MRIKKMVALLAAPSLILASTPAYSAGALSLSQSIRASASVADESELLDSGLLGVALVFGLGLIAGYLLHSVLSDDEEDQPASP